MFVGFIDVSIGTGFQLASGSPEFDPGKPGRRAVILGMLATVIWGLPAVSRADATDRATEFLINVLDEISRPQGFDLAGLIRQDAALDDIVDFIVDPELRGFSEQQRAAITVAFPGWLAARYRGQIGDLSQTEIMVQQVRRSRITGVKISTLFVWPDGSKAEIDWHIVTPDDEPKLIDLILDGDSMLKRERLVMLGLLENLAGDADALIEQLEAVG